VLSSVFCGSVTAARARIKPRSRAAHVCVSSVSVPSVSVHKKSCGALAFATTRSACSTLVSSATHASATAVARSATFALRAATSSARRNSETQSDRTLATQDVVCRNAHAALSLSARLACVARSDAASATTAVSVGLVLPGGRTRSTRYSETERDEIQSKETENRASNRRASPRARSAPEGPVLSSESPSRARATRLVCEGDTSGGLAST